MKRLPLLLTALLPLTATAVTPLWLRDAKIAPDGSKIAFTYKGDIWTVPAEGGQATRVTATDDYETAPVWSPDSRKIAFAGNAAGNFDIYIVDANGGAPVRLTYESASETPETFTADGKEILFSAAIQDPAESAVFPSGRMTEVYSVPVTGGKMRQIIATPARSISLIPGEKGSFLYQDVKGFEDEWRKHHTSSVTRDICLYDAKTGRHTNLTKRGGEDTNPVSGNNGDYYFLSERDGKTVNVYKANTGSDAKATALTDFKTHPVRFLSRADNGTLAFTYDGELYTMRPGMKAAKVKIDLTDPDVNRIEKLSVSGGSGASVSPDGKSVAFIYRGNVFVTSVEYKTTKQITDTPEAEETVTWSPDSKTLYYTTERDGKYNIYSARMTRDEEEPNFANATLITEEPVFKADGHERTMPDISPDGKKMAFILDRNKLAVMDLKTKKVDLLTDGSTHRQRGGGFSFEWSPDSKWIALEIIDRKHDPYSDIAIINVETGKMTNLTNSGYFDESPVWALDGNAILFASERYGMRNHASWGSEMDVMMVFLNQDAYDRFNLSEEDYALLKDVEKSNKKDEKAKTDDKNKAKDSKDKADKDEKAEKSKNIKVELDGIDRRVIRLTPMSSNLRSFAMTNDGEKLYYIIRGQDKQQLWKAEPRKDEVKMVSSVSGAGAFDATADGKTLFLFGQGMKKLDPKTDKMTTITASATMNLDPAAEREYMFDYISREEAERFYVKDMHGVDWPAMTAAYRRFLPHINNNYDFAEMISEWLGELNVSHTGGRYSHFPSSQSDRTATLGLIYDLSYDGPGLKVAEVVENGPFGNASTKMVAGSIVEKINGKDVSFGETYTKAMNNQSRKKTLVTFRLPGGETVEEVVLPTNSVNRQLYDRWVRQRAADVDRLSNGRLGYVHIESMDDESFRKVYSDVLGKYNDREGIVIDIRWNGGGRLHEDIEILFSGNKYFTQEIRGDQTCDMPSRRWNKPSIMIIAEPCYSNAHGTPWVYRHRGLGRLVGMPVPGTMTSVNWERLQDPTLIFGIPVVGYRLPDGSFLENQQLEPDVKVANDPATIVKGEDKQLKAAVEELLKEIDSAKK